MNFKVTFTNELPYMIQIPSEIYKIKTIIDNVEKFIELKLSDEIYRLHYSPFPEDKLGVCYEGTSHELERVVVKNRIPNYAFEKLKSYITCTIEVDKDFVQQDYDNIKKEELVDRLKTLILLQTKGDRSIDSTNLPDLAENEYLLKSSDEQELNNLKTNYLIQKQMNELSYGNIRFYYMALNNFIRQYSYVRKDFFVEPLTVHTLEGTNQRLHLNGNIYGDIKYARKAPSIMPRQKWMPDLDENILATLKSRLELDQYIPATESLILVARSLLERGEYRSAVIESSAALEIAVEEKLIEKLTCKGITQLEISKFLLDSQTNFYKRCDRQMRTCTGKSFIRGNSLLWNKVNSHRNSYRHKIAHSSEMPNEKKTEEIINDFEAAIIYIKSL